MFGGLLCWGGGVFYFLRSFLLASFWIDWNRACCLPLTLLFPHLLVWKRDFGFHCWWSSPGSHTTQGHLSPFHSLAIVNNVNIHVCLHVEICFQSSWALCSFLKDILLWIEPHYLLLMGCSVAIQYMYTVHNNQTRILRFPGSLIIIISVCWELPSFQQF